MEDFVVLELFSGNTMVEKMNISLYDFYDEGIDIIDDDECRRNKGVNKLIGTIFLQNGELIETRFINTYNDSGAIISSDQFNSELCLTESTKMLSDCSEIIGFYEISVYNKDGFNVNIKLKCKIQQVRCLISTTLFSYEEGKWVFYDSDKIEKFSNDENKGFFAIDMNFKIVSSKSYRASVEFEILENDDLLEKLMITSKELDC